MKFSIEIGRSKPAITGKSIRASTVLPWHAKALREVSETNRRMLRMYEAAITSNVNADQPVSITSADAELLTSITQVRSRSRRLERDDSHGWGIINLYQDNVGGDEPFRLEMKVGKKNRAGEFIEETDTNNAIEEAWLEAGLPENCTVRRDMSRSELYWQAISSVVRDGAILARHRPEFTKNDFGYAIEAIEIDRLDHYYNRPKVGENNEIRFSIEIDEFGGAEFYHILKRHPGDVFAFSNQASYRERVPADKIIALFDIRTRAGQMVTTSRLASIIKGLHQSKQFNEAHVTAAIWSACKPLFILQKFPTAFEGAIPDHIKSAIGEMMGEGREGERVDVVSPGETETLPPYHEPFLVDPKFPIESATGFKKDNLRAAATGSGVPYHQLSGDLESVNFSSGRLGENQFHDTCKKLQKHIITNYVRRHFNKWLEYAIITGKVKQPISRLKDLQRAAVFYGRRWPYINPLQDAQADILRIESGLTSRSRVIAESDRGGDVESVDAEIAADRKCDEAHGLDFTGADPTEPNTEGGEPGDEPPKVEGGEAPKKTAGKQTITKPGKSLRNLLLNGFARNGEHAGKGHV